MCLHLLSLRLVFVTNSQVETKKRVTRETCAYSVSAGCLVLVWPRHPDFTRAQPGVDSSLALAVSLTVHARQDGGTGICNDFANTGNPCVPGGVQLGMAYVSSAFGESSRACGLGASKLTGWFVHQVWSASSSRGSTSFPGPSK